MTFKSTVRVSLWTKVKGKLSFAEGLNTSSITLSVAALSFGERGGGFADGQVASIQLNRGCCPGGIKGQRHYRLFSFMSSL